MIMFYYSATGRGEECCDIHINLYVGLSASISPMNMMTVNGRCEKGVYSK